MAGATRKTEKAYWIIVADESRAAIYTRNTKKGPLTELLLLDNEVSRKKIGEIISDRGGRSFDSFGAGRHAMTAEKADPKKQAAIVFAKDIAERIGKATHDGSCRGYALIAAPRFLGMLRAAVSLKCRTEPFETIDKDVVGQDVAVIQSLVDSR